jgi:two-component system, sensor histidine kinase
MPISRKLYFTVGIMGLLIMIELGTLTFAIRTLSSVRAYVGAEGLWSKAQKDAAYSLQTYGSTQDESDFRDFENYLKVPMGDRKTRLELAKKHPDMNIARQGFIEGRVHPDDIDGAIKLFRRFHSIYYIDQAIKVWTKGDSLMSEFIANGNALHTEITAPSPSADKIAVLVNKIDPLNDQLTALEDEFSFILGEGSRWLENLILHLLFFLVLTVEICGLTLTILVSRGISKGLNEIIDAAKNISRGNHGVRAKIYSGDEIGVLANAFNEMTQKLNEYIGALKESEEDLKTSKKIAEQSLIVKKNFLTNVTHEIRTPMNAVLGFTALLENSSLDADQRQIVHSMKVSGQTLMVLINDILDFSKIESGVLVLEEITFNVRHLFESLDILLQQKSAEKKLSLKISVARDIPEYIIGDPTRLMQILLNLTDNAIKFTEKGGVEIDVVTLSETDESLKLEFRVKDSGEGIHQDNFSIIFERFTQLSAETTRKHGGTGLGLSIVKSLVELQKGHLSLQSESGKGSTFSFTITYKKSSPGKAASLESPVDEKDKAGNAAEIKKEPLNILVAEDNPINQMLMTRVLKKFGLTGDIAENGKIALEKLQEKRYDLILMDIQMPEMDGYEATAVIRKELKNNIPIVALTAHSMSREKEKCLEVGMNDFISKPFDQKHLYETIVSLCAVKL